VLLAPAVALAQSTSISSLSPDVAAAIVLFVAASALLSLLSDPQTTEGGLQFGLLLITTLLAVAVTFKSTVTVFAALAWPLAILAAYRVSRSSASRRPIEKTVLAALALSLALGVSWVGNGLVTTGYPAYPSDLWGIPADWRVPEEQAQAELAWIGHWARNYFGPEARNFIPYGARLTWEWRWLAPWLASLILHVQALWTIVLPLLLVALSVSAYLRQRRRSRGDVDRPAGRGWWLLLPTTLGLVFWFLVAPRPLFGLPLFWILAATVGAHVVDSLARRRAWTGRRMVTMAIVVAALPLLVTPFPGLLRGAGTGLTPTWNPLLEMPAGHVLEPAPQVAVGRFTTDSGLLLYVPADNRCWDAPLPCTPHPASNLTLRRPGNLASGFRVEGGWLAQRYPSRHSTFLSLWRQYVGD
ncbi:MAG: hypothetical protein M3N51_07185, partial [Actinomycetota bacterium]|nr:hypothetical protein [Actinomycetota bacterium]